MTYSLGALGHGRGGGGGGQRMGGGGGHHGGGHHGGGHHGGGHHGGGHHHHGGHGHGGGFRRGWGGRRGGGWYGGGGYGPGFIDYVSYSPCDECWGQPPTILASCLRYRGCLPPEGLGQLVVDVRPSRWLWAIPVVVFGIILLGGRKSITWGHGGYGPGYYGGYYGGYSKPTPMFGKPGVYKNKRTSRRKKSR